MQGHDNYISPYYSDLKSEIMEYEHIENIIQVYTDFTALFTHFSSSYRAINKYEPFELIKKRHQKYYWMGKGLKKVIGTFSPSHSYRRFIVV